MPKKRLLYFLLPAFILLIFTSIAVPYWISPFDLSAIEYEILWQLRIPKTISACLCGIALAVSGFILQQLFRNNLAGPYILGISSGASLAVALVIIGAHYFPVLNQGITLSLAGFAGAFTVLALVLAVSIRFGSAAIILLFGVIIGQIFGAFQGVLNYLAIPGDLKYFSLWSMGSYAQVLGSDLIIFSVFTVSGLLGAFLFMPELALMVLGRDTAGSSGVHTKKVSLYLLLCTGILSGVATAYCGPIAFIGMAVPNASRLLFKTANFKRMFFVNALLGASMALVSDILSSIEIFNLHLPVNVCTALIGGPFIIYILLRKRH